MKDKIRYFFKIRKQNDMVKLICLFVLAEIAFVISVVYHAGRILYYVNTSAEYVLTGENAVSKKRMDELLQNRDVGMVSRQMEIPITIFYRGVGMQVNVTVLSQEYMEKMLGEEVPTGTKRVYMNETAFSELQRVFSEKNVEIKREEKTGDRTEYDIRYCITEVPEDPEGNDGTAVISDQRTAKLVVQDLGGQEGDCAVFITGMGSELQKDACSLRVQFIKHDLDGLHVSHLRKQGYVIENEDSVIQEEYVIRENLLHIRYGLLCCVICLIATFALKRTIAGR